MRLGVLENWMLGQLVGTKRRAAIIAAVAAADWFTAGRIFSDWLAERFGLKATR